MLSCRSQGNPLNMILIMTISFRPVVLRVLFVLLMASGLGALGYLAARAAIGDSIMTFVQRNPNLSIQGKIEGADLAVRFSTRDPLIHWQRGGVYFNAANEVISDEWLKTSLKELKIATLMSPEDYRIWLAYGRVLDRDGSTAEARAALEHALKLAPNHFEPHWALGNHLLRAGNRDGSFVHMRLALINRPSALPLVFDYAWSVYQGDGRAIAESLNVPVEIKAQLIAMLVSRGRVDDGLAVWNQMTAPTFRDVQRVTDSLISVGRYAAAYKIWKAASIPDRPVLDKDSLLANGSFEKNFAFNIKTPFYSWHVSPVTGVRVTFDRDKPQTGRQSMRLSFTVDGNNAFTLASQTIPVKPNQSYCLGFFVKSEELKSLSMPFVEMYDAADGSRAHAATDQFPIDQPRWDSFEQQATNTPGKKEADAGPPWRPYSLSITTRPETEALTVRIQRQPCPDQYCSLEGRLWFDSFKLEECQMSRK